MRVVSLLPSATETVAALGFEKSLVGRSHECDWPPAVRKLPVCSEPKFNPDQGSSREIDRQVHDLIKTSLSVYRVDAGRLRALAPDLIITQDHCQVCAVNLEDVKRAVRDWTGHETEIVTLRPQSLEDVFDGFIRVGEALGSRTKGEELAGECRARMKEVSFKALALPDSPSVMGVEWFDPLIAAGNWMPEFVEMLGARSVFGQPGKHAPKISWDDVCKADPDVLVLMACGWSIERNLQELPLLKAKPGWSQLQAVRAGRVYAVEGNQFFNRPGPRLVDSLEILAEILYPQAFEPRHTGSGWQNVKL